MKNDFQSRSTSAAADQAAGQSASDLQPLGVTAQAGATVAIYAELPSDATVYVVPTQFYGESGVWKGTPVALENGRNYITVQQIGSLGGRGGPLYITYSGSHPEQIKLQVRVVNNAWEMPVLELSSWYSMGESARKDAIRTYVQELSSYVAALPTSGLNTNVRNATEIFTPSVLLSLPADQVLSGLKSAGSDEDAMVNAMYQNVLAWEEELFIANKVQGIIDSNATLTSYQYPMTTRQNIRYMRMFAGADWTTAKTGTLSDDTVVAYFTKPGAAESDTRIWTYDAAVLEITGIPEDATVQLLDYPGDRVDFYEGATVGVLKDDYKYGDGEDDVIKKGTLVILGTYRGDPTYNYVSVEAVYNTTSEAAEANGVTTITRAMNGYGLLLAEIPADGAVSDTSDGFFIFVPDLGSEKELNKQDGVTDAYPLEIRAVFYRTDEPNHAGSQRVTSQTLWISFPGEDDLPLIDQKSDLSELKG